MEKTKVKQDILPILKGVLTALAITIIGILVFSVIYKFCNFSDNIIKIVNQVIKILSIFLGTLVVLKNNKTKGMIKGAIVGVIYMIFAYILFCLLVNTFSISISLLFDLIFASIVGVVSGIILVNIKK